MTSHCLLTYLPFFSRSLFLSGSTPFCLFAMSAAAAPPAFTPQQLHLSILQYLTHLQQSGGESAKAAGIVDLEPLEVAIQCLTEATGVSYQPNQILSNDAGLSELYQIGSRTLSSLESHPKYSSFLATLKSSDFFKGIQEGSFEYVQRLEQARQKFQEKFLNGGEQTTEAAPAPAASASAAPVEVTAEMKSAAESAKNEGNALLGKGDHAGAVAKYSDAIKLNPNHAIYFANRAAAYVNLREYKKAIADCESSIFLDPAYPKSHYRLGQSLAALGEHANAIDAFEAALSRSGRDEGMAVTIREQIKISKAKLNPTPAHAGGADPFAALGGMGGLGGLDFGSLLNNPALAGLMNSPEIANMMKSPDMMNMMKVRGKDTETGKRENVLCGMASTN